MVQDHGNMALQVFSDSEILIKILNSEDYFNNLALNNTLHRLRGLLHTFSYIIFFYILRSLNKEAYANANEGCSLTQGVLRKNIEAPLTICIM